MRAWRTLLRGLIALAILLMFALGLLWQSAFPTIADLPDVEMREVSPAE